MALLSVASLYFLLWSSIPQYDGHRSSKHVNEVVIIDRDELGVPTVKAKSRETVSYGIGFCHGQNRFFQMDLQRCSAAGELSALFGVGTLHLDKANRIHGFRERAKLLLATLPDNEKALLEHYSRGVNEGLASLKTRPPEY